MSRHAFLPLAAVLLLPLLLLLSFRGEDGLYQVYIPSGYIKEVNRLIREGKLVYDCTTEEIAARDLTEGEQYFLDNSYLERDLARWNAGDRTPFVVTREELPRGRCNGRLEEVNESFHNQRLPTYTVTSWRGRLFLRQGLASVTLSSPDRLLEVTRPPWRRLPLPARAFEDTWLDRSGDVRSERMALKLFEAGRMLASLEHIGDQVAVEVIQRQPEIFLNGCPVPQGGRLRLDDGDWVRFLDRGDTEARRSDERRIDERYLVEAGGAAGLVSYINVVNGEIRRRTFGNRLAMAGDVTRAVDTAVRRASEGRSDDLRDDFDIRLTLDAFFHDLLTRRLGEFCRDPRHYGRRPLRAGVTLLEAGSGRVLALASYPGPGDLERLALRHGADAAALARNHNFLQHPVGSATKPFLAAAALATRPRLATLALPCFPGGEPPETFLGYDFGTYNLPADCIGNQATITFRRFLEVSSNRYMLALGLLAMADWHEGSPRTDRNAPALPPLDRYALGGHAQTYRPRLDIVKDESRPGLTELAAVQDEPFFRNFRDLFAHEVHYQAGSAADTLDLEPWQPVLDAAAGNVGSAGAGDRATALAFAPVTPERVNLRANLIQQLRQDLYTTLLGLGNNRWSNLQLAESLARLATGRAVTARLVERVELPPPPEEPRSQTQTAAPEVLWDLETVLEGDPPGEIPLAPESRRLILDGMTDVVVESAGTAHEELAPALRRLDQAPPGVRYRVLAKTGTPSTDLAVVRRGPTEPAPGAVKTYSGRRQVNHGVLLLAVSREAGGETETLALSIFIEAQGGSEQAVQLAAELLPPLVEAYWPEDWLEEAEAP